MSALNNEILENLRKINELERENTILKLKIDEVQQSSKKELANLKLGIAKEKGIHERTIMSLNSQIEGIFLYLKKF